MTNLMVLHWGQVSKTVNISQADPASATISGRKASGRTRKVSGSGKTRRVVGSG